MDDCLGDSLVVNRIIPVIQGVRIARRHAEVVVNDIRKDAIDVACARPRA